MAERLTISKLIRDLSRPPEPFFGPSWQEENKLDIARARQLHAAAQPDSSELTEQEIYEQGDGREDVEELPGRGPWA